MRKSKVSLALFSNPYELPFYGAIDALISFSLQYVSLQFSSSFVLIFLGKPGVRILDFECKTSQ